MPESDPSRDFTVTGISEPKGHSPKTFVAPAGKSPFATGEAHHPAPIFTPGPAGPGNGPKPDWPSVLDELGYGFAILGPKQEVRHENVACRQMTGYGIAEKGGVEGWLSALCPDTGHREKVIASWREHIWRNQLKRTFTLRTPDQKLKEIEFRSSLLRDGGITLTLDDVTAQRRDEERLRHGKLKFRALFTHTRTGTVLVDRTGRIIDANPAFLRLSGSAVKQLRLSPLASLLHPDDAPLLAEADAPGGREHEVRLRTPRGEQEARIAFVPVTEGEEPSGLSLCLFEPLDAELAGEQLKTRLRTVSRKAQALLQAVPDLILLINEDGTVADYAPPPKAWRELSPDDSWRRQSAAKVWPALGDLLGKCRGQVLEAGQTIHAEIRGTGDEDYEFATTLSSCGDGQMLVVVRNLSDQRALRERDHWQGEAFARAPLPMFRLDDRGRIAETNAAAAALLGGQSKAWNGAPFSTAPLPKGSTAEFLALEEGGQPRGSIVFVSEARERTAPAGAPSEPQRERRQHGFRNQLQLVTSLFSLEPQGADAREAFLKWQVRLRSMAHACPYDDSAWVWVQPLLRNIADEVCSLAGKGPGRREVLVTGDEDLVVATQTALPFSLLMGELMRLVLAARQPGPGPELYFHLRSQVDGGFALTVRPGAHRTFVFTDRHADIESLELLTEQIQGRLEPTDTANPSKEWILTVPGARP